MKKIDLGQSIGILANIGVIAGIIFLAVELQQNNALLEAEARFNLLEHRAEITTLQATDIGLSELLTKTRAGESLTRPEAARIASWAARHLLSWEWQYREFQNGALSENELPVQTWRGVFHRAIPPMAEYWDGRRANFDPDFVQFMEENVVNER